MSGTKYTCMIYYMNLDELGYMETMRKSLRRRNTQSTICLLNIVNVSYPRIKIYNINYFKGKEIPE